MADNNGLAPIRSPAATKIVFLWPSPSCLTREAICSEPPAGTVIFLVLSVGSAILIPPDDARRYPWKSLIARMRKSTVADCAATGVAGYDATIRKAKATASECLMARRARRFHE